MSSSLRTLTAEDLWNMPEHGGHNELIEGELRPMTPAGYQHGRVGVEVTFRLAHHVRTHDLGDVLGSETGFVLARDPDTVLAPDVAFVTRARSEAIVDPVRYFEGPPDLAVEVISPWDRPKDVRAKAKRWVQHGTRLVWVVDPKSQTIEVFAPNRDPETLSGDQTLDGRDVVIGFACRVAELFGASRK